MSGKCLTMVLMSIWLGLGFCGCEKQDVSLKKEKDCEFTVVKEEEIPKELMAIIEEKEKEPFRMAYTGGEELYVVVGYGAQIGGGYSIAISNLYETKENIYIETSLIGPKQEQQTQKQTYPYIVVKLEYIEKEVIYET